MTTKNRSITKVEEFVRRVLEKSFKQEVDDETLRVVAKKVSRAVAVNSPPKAA